LHEVYPGNHIYIEMAAQIYDHLGSYDKEAEFWEEYLNRAPTPVTACPMIGQAYWKQGNQKEAIAAFERCLAYDPDNSDSIFFLAHALETSGQSERARELYERGAKIAPTYTDLQLGRARFLLRHGGNVEALNIALTTLEKNPENTDALLVAGLACTQEKQRSRARDYLNRGVKLSDGDTDFHFALARLDEQEKNFGDAIVEYERILKLHPDDSVARSRRDALKEKH
jgi:tetratricopeptide (TPR) repeat protein